MLAPFRGLLRLWSLRAHLPVLLLLIVLVGTGLRGIDFGDHPDEAASQLFPAKVSLETGVFLPGNYRKPSVGYWLSLVGTLPEIPAALQAQGAGKISAAHYLADVARSDWFRLRIRAIFVVLSAVGVLWVYLLILAWGRHWTEAWLGAALLGLSWEVAYHSRWIAPDAVMMQFGALTMLSAMLAWWRPDQRIWLPVAAAAAGLACGTKYTGGLLLLPVLLVAVLSPGGPASIRRRAGALVVAGLTFGLVYLVTTPGTLLEAEIFTRDLQSEIRHYQTGHRGHTVAAGPRHLERTGIYFTQVFFSTYPPLAVAVFGAAMLGAYALFRESRRTTLLYLLFPVVFVLYMSTQRVMFVRNLLVVAPFLAVLAARGTAFLWTRLGSRGVRLGLVGLTAALCVVNAAWLVAAAATISSPDRARFVDELAAYIEARPATRFLVSERVWDELDVLAGGRSPNVTRDPTTAFDEVAFYAHEAGPYAGEWPANLPDLIIASFGPQSVNLSYYPTFPIGTAEPNPILVMQAERARAVGVPVLHFAALRDWVGSSPALRRLDGWGARIFGLVLEPNGGSTSVRSPLDIPLSSGPAVQVSFLATLSERTIATSPGATLHVSLVDQDLVSEPLRELFLDPTQVEREGWVPFDVVVPPRASLTRLRLSLACNVRPECPQAPVWLAPVGDRPAGIGQPTEEVGPSTRSTEYASLVLSDEPIAYWQLNAGTNGMRDSTGNGHDGVINGLGRTVPGLDGPALSFDDRGGSVEVAHDGALNGVDRALTIEAWVKPERSGGIVDKNRRTGWSLYLGESDFRAAIAGASIFGGTWTPGQWYHVVLTIDRGQARLYVNGTTIGQSASNRITSTDRIRIGRMGGATGFLTGVIDEVAVYDQALSPSRIQAHWARGQSLAQAD